MPTRFPSGVSSYGIPLPTSVDVAPGSNIFFVSSVTGSDSNVGDDPNNPRATLSSTIAKCRANVYDQIWLLPNHTETVTTAAGIAPNVAGIAIVGIGTGAIRPTITFSTAVGASMDITAANIIFSNLIFTCNIDNQTAMVNLNTADVTFADCVFNTNSGTVGAARGILTAATAARFAVKRCRFLGPATNTGTTTTAQISHEVGVDYVIEDCYFTGKMTQAITNASAILRGSIHNNRFVIATGTVAINMHASSTPFITNNRINVPSGTAPVVAAAGFVAGNAYSAAAGVTAGAAATW